MSQKLKQILIVENLKKLWKLYTDKREGEKHPRGVSRIVKSIIYVIWIRSVSL
mgnify:CR=1 FL=1